MATVSITAVARLDYARAAACTVTVSPCTIRTFDELEEEFTKRLRQARKEVMAQLEQLQDAESERSSDSSF